MVFYIQKYKKIFFRVEYSVWHQLSLILNNKILINVVKNSFKIQLLTDIFVKNPC